MCSRPWHSHRYAATALHSLYDLLSEVAPKEFLTRAMAEKEATKPRPKKEFATRRH